MKIPPIRISEEAIQRIRDAGMCPQKFLNDTVPSFHQSRSPHPRVRRTRFYATRNSIVMVQVRPGEDIWVGISEEQVLEILEELNEGVMPMAPPGEA